MKKSVLLKFSSALAVVAYLTTRSFAMDAIELGNDNNPITQKSHLLKSIDLDSESDQLITTAPLEALGKQKANSEEANSKFDKVAKLAMVGVGTIIGASLAYFYGPALAFGTAYKVTMGLAQFATPHPSWAMTNLVIKPAAINAGVAFANSSLVKTGITAVGATGSYYLSGIGYSAYEVTKEGFNWIASKISR